MKIGRVVGQLWATAKDPHLEGSRMLFVQPLDLAGETAGDAYLALDTVQAGPGDRVLVVDEGNAAGQVLGLDQPPIRTVIVGVIDEVSVVRETE